MSGRHASCAALALVLLTLISGVEAGGATYRLLPLDALVESSDYIVYGRVIRRDSQWDPATRAIWTRTELRILDCAKGKAGASLSVTEPGGIAGGRGELYPGIPHFEIGQEVVLFVYRAPGNRLRVTGLLQGVYSVVADPQTGERMAASAVPRAEVVYRQGSNAGQAAEQALPDRDHLGRLLNLLRLKASTR